MISDTSDKQNFRLKIRPNCRGQFDMTVNPEMLISEVKSKIASICQIPVSQQRLISNGKLLKDNQKLSFYKVSEGHVIQLSSQPQDLPELEQNDPSSNRRERNRGIDLNERYETIRQSITTVNLMYDILNPRIEEEIIGFDNKKRVFSVGQ